MKRILLIGLLLAATKIYSQTLTATGSSFQGATSATCQGTYTETFDDWAGLRLECHTNNTFPSVGRKSYTLSASDVNNGNISATITGLSSNTTYYFRFKGTSLLDDVSYTSNQNLTFTTTSPVSLPVLSTTTPAGSITSSSAVLGGNISTGTGITARGVCYSLTSANANPEIGGIGVTNEVEGGTATGTFSETISGLAVNTGYSFKAYATNSAGTAYGSVVTFTTLSTVPSVSTIGYSDITQTTAVGSGQLTANGGLAITARGICYSTTSNPDVFGTKTSGGTSVAAYDHNITGLNAGTTYYIRAYATNGNGTAYGSETSFMTSAASAPVLVNTAATSIGIRSANIGGNISSDGGSNVTERGVVYSLTSLDNNPIIGGANVTKITSGSGTGAFAVALSNLNPGANYSFKAYAINGAGTSYGAPTATFTCNNIKQAHSITFPSINNSSLGLSWTNGTGDVRMVVAREGSAVNANPVNGTNYSASSTFGTGDQIGTGNYVVYQAAANTQTITNLKGTTTYHFKVYEVLGSGSNIYYNLIDTTGNPASQITLAKTAPIAQATNITLSNATNTSMGVTWTNGSGDYRIVTARRTVMPKVDPVNYIYYAASTNFGVGDETGYEGSGNFVVYNGTGNPPNPLTITGLTTSTSYTFVVYEYNNTGATTGVYNITVNTGAGGNSTAAATLGPVTWDGSSSANWNDGTNWNTGQVPGASTSITIPNTNYTFAPVISTGGPFSVNNLTIESGVSLTISSSATLNVLGNVLLKSPANETSTGQIVIQVGGNLNVTGTSTMERYYTNNLNWRYVSSPLTSPNITPWTGFYVNSYNTATKTWQYLDANSSIGVMQGISVVDSLGAKTITFTGTFNNGNISRAVTNVGGGDNNGWNLVGNPYPSAINWGAGTGITKTNIDAAAYLFNSLAGTYAPCTNSPCYIPAGQGFFVHATTTGTLAFTNACRSINIQSFNKNGIIEQPKIILGAKNEVYETQAFVSFESNATSEFDSEYDAYKLMSPNENIADIYTLTNSGTKLAINTLNLESIDNLPENGLVLPIGLTTGINGAIEISATEISNISENIFIYLHDKQLDKHIDLKQDSYKLQIAYNTDTRFELLITQTAVSNKEIKNLTLDILIYTQNKTAFVKSTLFEQNKGEIQVFDIMGRLLFDQPTENSNIQEVPLQKAGTYIIKIIVNNTVATQKVVVN